MQKTAFLLVHGVGDFSSDRVLSNANAAIRRRFPGLGPTDAACSDELPGTILRRNDVVIGTQRVRVAAFHWSGAFGKLRRLNPFATLWYLLGFFAALPGLGAYGSRARSSRLLLRGGGAALWLGLALCTTGIAALVAEVVRATNLDFEMNSQLGQAHPLALGMLLIVMLLMFGCIGYATSLGWRARQRGRTAQWLGLLSGTLLAFPYLAVSLIVAGMLGVLFVESLSVGARVMGVIFLGGASSIVTLLLLGIVDLLRDVVVYLQIDRHGNENKTTLKMRARVIDALDDLVADGFAEIVLVAHSLGSAIAVEALNEWQPDTDARPRVSLVTCGSPLRRWLQPLLPNRFADPATVHQSFARSARIEFRGWTNCYRVADPVGQRLFRKTDTAANDGILATDRLLRPWWHPPFFHGNFWGDRRFMDEVVRVVSS